MIFLQIVSTRYKVQLKNEGGKVGREKESKEEKHSPKEQSPRQNDESSTEKDKVNRASNNDPVRGHNIDIKT